MKGFAAAVGVIVVVLGAGIAALARSEPAGFQPIDYVISITSGVPGTEVEFEGAVWFAAPEAPLQTISRKTPYEIRSSGAAASGIFRAKGSDPIQVELVATKASQPRARSKAAGRAVVVGDNVASDGTFIRTF